MKLAYLGMRASEFPFAIVDCHMEEFPFSNRKLELEIGNRQSFLSDDGPLAYSNLSPW
jgi:hypothetical protein